MAQTTNALVTYDDLQQMNIVPKVGTVTPDGNECATKNFINTYYNVDTGASPYSGYANNRYPRYQDILPNPNPFILCYNLTIGQFGGSGCNGTDQYQVWTIDLRDQFDVLINTPTTLTFTVSYDTSVTEDVPPFYSTGTGSQNITINAGTSSGATTIYTYQVNNCPMSGVCDGTCFTTATNLYISAAPSSLGTCPLPTPNCGYTQTLFPSNFLADTGSATGYSWKWQSKTSGGIWQPTNYSCFPNTTWNIFSAVGVSVYSGSNTTFVPWIGTLNNGGTPLAAGTYFFNVDLGAGAGVQSGKIIKLF